MQLPLDRHDDTNPLPRSMRKNAAESCLILLNPERLLPDHEYADHNIHYFHQIVIV